MQYEYSETGRFRAKASQAAACPRRHSFIPNWCDPDRGGTPGNEEAGLKLTLNLSHSWDGHTLF